MTCVTKAGGILERHVLMKSREDYHHHSPAVIPSGVNLAVRRSDYCRLPTKHGINIIEGSANDSLLKDGNIKQAVQRKSWCNDKDRKVEPSYTSDGWKALRHIFNEHVELPHHRRQR
jgi:hypothetical protein